MRCWVFIFLWSVLSKLHAIPRKHQCLWWLLIVLGHCSYTQISDCAPKPWLFDFSKHFCVFIDISGGSICDLTWTKWVWCFFCHFSTKVSYWLCSIYGCIASRLQICIHWLIKTLDKQTKSFSLFLHWDYRVFFKNNLIIYVACLRLRDTVHHLTHLLLAPGKHLQLL